MLPILLQLTAILQSWSCSEVYKFYCLLSFIRVDEEGDFVFNGNRTTLFPFLIPSSYYV